MLVSRSARLKRFKLAFIAELFASLKRFKLGFGFAFKMILKFAFAAFVFVGLALQSFGFRFLRLAPLADTPPAKHESERSPQPRRAVSGPGAVSARARGKA